MIKSMFNLIRGAVSQTCNEDGMEFTLRTPEGFTGRIYTYGFYDRCFFRGTGGLTNVLRITGPRGFPDCGSQRVRFYSFSLLIKRHRVLIRLCWLTTSTETYWPTLWSFNSAKWCRRHVINVTIWPASLADRVKQLSPPATLALGKNQIN